MDHKQHIIILGGGQVAAYAAKEIRLEEKNINISIISEEVSLPYERPPLSKECLLTKKNYEECLFFSSDFYRENNINFINNEKIINVKFDQQTLISANNKTYFYDKLLIATGSINRKLKLNESSEEIDKNLIYLRNIEDSKKIKHKLTSSKKILILGGGFIGLEIASAANQLGKEVAVVEIADHLMGRVIPKQIAKIIQNVHEKNGTKFYLGESIKKIIKKNNQYQVELEHRIVTEVDLIIVGIGSNPNINLFKDSELQLDNGIMTNEFCQTSIKNVFAAGDIANFYHPFYNKHMRLESFKHAQNHGINAGKNIVGKRTAYTKIPWMWSDQFDLNLQLTGICNNYETYVQRGKNVNEGIIYFFLKNRRIIGACGVGIGGKIGRDIRLAGKLSEKKIKLNKEILSDKNQKLNKI